VFDPAGATARTIRDEDRYSGARVSLTATLSNARLSLHVDVNVGDPIWPAPTTVQVPRLLGGSITVTGYPLPMVPAEKITTAVQRGTANTRWRDIAPGAEGSASSLVVLRSVAEIGCNCGVGVSLFVNHVLGPEGTQVFTKLAPTIGVCDESPDQWWK